MRSVLATVIAAAFGIQPLPQPDGPLEPSVQNEVDRAIRLGERWLAAQRVEGNDNASSQRNVALCHATNGLAREAIAVKLVSSQRTGGWWITPTNAAPTRQAVEILKGL